MRRQKDVSPSHSNFVHCKNEELFIFEEHALERAIANFMFKSEVQISNKIFTSEVVVGRKCSENAFGVQLDELDPADFGDSGNGIIIPDFKTSRVQKCRGRRKRRKEGGLEAEGGRGIRTGIMKE